jgi:hypothetical protein
MMHLPLGRWEAGSQIYCHNLLVYPLKTVDDTTIAIEGTLSALLNRNRHSSFGSVFSFVLIRLCIGLRALDEQPPAWGIESRVNGTRTFLSLSAIATRAEGLTPSHGSARCPQIDCPAAGVGFSQASAALSSPTRIFTSIREIRLFGPWTLLAASILNPRLRLRLLSRLEPIRMNGCECCWVLHSRFQGHQTRVVPNRMHPTLDFHPACVLAPASI